MRKSIIAISSLVAMLVTSCEKPNVTVNTGQAIPPYIISGIHDINITNGSGSFVAMPINVVYSDSAQETVILSLSALPNGIVMDTSVGMEGLPSFSTNLIFYDTTQTGATTGTYPMTLTATGSKTGARSFKFNMKVLPEPYYTANIVGSYHHSSNYCGSGNYTDSVYNDASIINKIWFTNFGNYGISIYAYVSSNYYITIPNQVVNGYTVSGSGNLSSGFPSYLYFNNVIVVHNSVSNNCTLNMNR